MPLQARALPLDSEKQEAAQTREGLKRMSRKKGSHSIEPTEVLFFNFNFILQALAMSDSFADLCPDQVDTQTTVGSRILPCRQ